MKSFVGATFVNNTSRNHSFVKPEFRKGFQIPMLPYQQYGIMSRVFWPSKTQVVRILPGYDPQTGEVFRQNINCTQFSMDRAFDEYLSDTFCRATVVNRFGGIKSPFISDYAPGSEDERQWGGETVLHNFIRGIIYACSPNTKRPRIKPIKEWSMWTGFGPSATLSYDKPSLLMQALVFHLNGADNKDYETQQPLVDKDGDILPLLAVVAMDNQQSILNLCQALVEPANPGLPLDAASNNKYGAMAELEGNKLFLNPYTDAKQHSALRPSVQPAGQSGWKPTPFPLSAEVVKQLWHPWEDVLNYMTAQEQLQLCADEFGADTVNYVIGTDPKFHSLEIPQSIKSVGLGRYAMQANEGASASVSGTISKAAGVTNSLSFGVPAQQQAPQQRQQPQQPQAAFKPDFSAIQNTTGIDMQAILKQTEAIRAVTAPTEAQQAATAASLLGGTDMPDDEAPWDKED